MTFVFLRVAVVFAALGLFTSTFASSMPRNEKAIATLTKSDKSRELARAAQELAAGTDAEDHAALLRFLRDAGFRARLDPPEVELAGADDLMLSRPLRSLATNKAAIARETLRQLLGDRDFNGDPDRVDLLLRATATWRPAEPVVVAYWKKLMDPDGVHAEITVNVAVENASQPAVVFFEECLRDARFGEDLRRAWMRRQLLMHRNEEPFVRLSERLFVEDKSGALSPALKFALAEALFDFKQEEWYPPHNPPRPPVRARTPRTVRDIYRKIAALVRERFDPDANLEAAIAEVLTQFDALDRSKAP